MQKLRSGFNREVAGWQDITAVQTAREIAVFVASGPALRTKHTPSNAQRLTAAAS